MTTTAIEAPDPAPQVEVVEIQLRFTVPVDGNAWVDDERAIQEKLGHILDDYFGTAVWHDVVVSDPWMMKVREG